jgi:adenosylcobinamide-GDP ribazoletransferase
MRDSRLGSYGGTGLALALLIRAAALAALPGHGAAAAILVPVAAESLSRGALVWFWRALPPARADGLAHDAGRPDGEASFTTLVLAGAIALVAGLAAVGPWATVIGIGGAAAAAAAFARLCRAQIGGQTGDTLGAVQQVSLGTFLVLVLAFA